MGLAQTSSSKDNNSHASICPKPTMASVTKTTSSIFLLVISSSSSLFLTLTSSKSTDVNNVNVIPSPTPWPEQFHSILVVNYSGSLQLIDLWYDWPKGRNFNIIQHQLGTLLYDLEWNNGTSFVYTLDSSAECRTLHPGVGLLPPNWLDGANYLGQQQFDGFLCNVWEKVDFIWYYEDVVTKRPVHWVFYTGRNVHVMTFEVGATLEDSKWQAPVYCFDKKEKDDDTTTTTTTTTTHVSLKKKQDMAMPLPSVVSISTQI